MNLPQPKPPDPHFHAVLTRFLPFSCYSASLRVCSRCLGWLIPHAGSSYGSLTQSLYLCQASHLRRYLQPSLFLRSLPHCCYDVPIWVLLCEPHPSAPLLSSLLAACSALTFCWCDGSVLSASEWPWPMPSLVFPVHVLCLPPSCWAVPFPGLAALEGSSRSALDWQLLDPSFGCVKVELTGPRIRCSDFCPFLAGPLRPVDYGLVSVLSILRQWWYALCRGVATGNFCRLPFAADNTI
uniref:Uncharacterized protein n=1 Tax=Opuntia streptacantha TaxID=393608 RepID=A0A7C9CRN8_OPUST